MPKTNRREFVRDLAGATASTMFAAGSASRAYASTRTCDVAVIGAGVFGSWTAYHLRKGGRKVILVDAYGASNARASSGGESRVIRMGYGPDEVYTRFARRSLGLWKELFQRTGDPLFQQVGVLWLGKAKDPRLTSTLQVFGKLGIEHEQLHQAELRKRYPQIALDEAAWAIYEPGSGALLARRAVQTLVREMTGGGLEYLIDPVVPPSAAKHLAIIRTRGGAEIAAEKFVFACGPWLPKVFPDALGSRIFPTRQEVFFFGCPAGDRRFAPPAMPCWIDVADLYGIPDLENRGFKIANDQHGPPADPDTMDRFVSEQSVHEMRKRLGERFPPLAGAPLLETRVCQYENSSNGDFLLDRHPEMDNVWLAGGGSGHGFKHGPAVGEYLSGQILGNNTAEPRFSFASKGTEQKRAIY